MTGKHSAKPIDAAVPAGQAAIDKIQPLLDALKDEEVGVYNLDSTHVSTQLSLALPRLEAMFDELETLPHFDLASVKLLKTLVPALVYSNALVLAHSPDAADFDTLATEARAVRETMLIAVDMLVNRGAIAKATVDKIRSGHGVYDLIDDLTVLNVLIEKHDDGTLIPAALRKRVAELIVELPTRYAQRLGKDPALAPLLNQRKKIAALIIRAYAEAQAGVAYLRRKHNDADTITPSIYVLRGPSKKDPRDDADPVEKPAPTDKPAPAKPANPLLPSDNPFENKS